MSRDEQVRWDDRYTSGDYAPRTQPTPFLLEWLARMPDESWGVRSIPEIDSRQPLWDQPNFMKDVDEGRFYLPDAEEGLRETLVTTTVDAKPVQCLRVPGPTFLTFWAAMFTGGVFIFATFHFWWAALISAVCALVVILRWLWTGTAWIPEKEKKDVGLGLELPIYVSGPRAVGWWAMFITMLGDMTAAVALVFGYLFFWTSGETFPPEGTSGPGVLWPSVGAAMLLGSWALTRLARRWNRSDRRGAYYGGLVLAALLALAGGGALLMGPHTTGLDPTAHAYPAIVWVLMIWTALHAAVGALMQLYCVARRWAGKMTARYDADIVNVGLYWHFVALNVVINVGLVVGFPRVV